MFVELNVCVGVKLGGTAFRDAQEGILLVGFMDQGQPDQLRLARGTPQHSWKGVALVNS